MIINDTKVDYVYKIEPQPNDQTGNVHLLWMLQEIELNTKQSLTKKHRWLGYIQCALICRGVTTVNEERDATRELFDGE